MKVSIHKRIDEIELVLNKATDLSFPKSIPGLVNYLGLGLGAGVYPPLTSASTAQPSRTRLEELFSNSLDPAHIQEAGKAMQKWSEHGECWCTPVTEGAQLAFFSTFNPHITMVQLEFISPGKAASRRHMQSAPREFELWALDPDSKTEPSPDIAEYRTHLSAPFSKSKVPFFGFRKMGR